MKKYIIVALLAFLQFDVSAQTLIPLHVDNSEPRVGETITLSFNVSFLIETIKAQSKDSLQFVANSMGYQSRNDKLLSKIKYETEGVHVVGPFSFTFNGVDYTTDSIEVNVLPSIPNEVGIWVRTVIEEGETYVIIEQNMKDNDKTSKKHKANKAYPMGMSEEKQASLQENPEEGLRFNRVFMNISSSSVEIGKESSHSLRHYYSKFKVTLSDEYQSDGELKPEYFTNLPRDFKLDKINFSE